MKIVDSLIKKIEHSFILNHLTILVILGLGIYGRGLFGEFLWDDLDQIANNLIVHDFRNLAYFFTHSTFYSGGAELIGLYYRPLATTLFSLTYQVWGQTTFGYHLTSLVLHITNAILIFFLLRKLLNLQNIPYSQTSAFLASLLFLIHPTQVESVAYISATSEVLYTFFLLLSFWVTLSYCVAKKTKIKLLVGISLLILLALFAKEAAVVGVVMLLLYVLWFYRHRFLPLLSACLISLGIYSLFRFFFSHFSPMQTAPFTPMSHATLSDRLITLPYALASYVRLFVFPKELHIAQQDLMTSISDSRFGISLLVVVIALGIGAWVFFKTKSKLAGFFLLWFGLSLSLVLNVIPLDYTIEERWLYFPLIGLLGFLAMYLSQVISEKRNTENVLIFILLLVFIPFFVLRSFVRVGDWKNELTLYQHDSPLSQSSVELQTNYATALYRAGDKVASEKQYQTVLALTPTNYFALNNLGSLYAQEGKYEEAKKLYTKSIKITPTANAYENLAQIYVLTDQPNNVISFVEQALIYFPNSSRLHYFAAISYYKQNDIKKAKSEADQAAKLNPGDQDVLTLLQILQSK